MSNKDYYERWLKLKEQFRVALQEDERIQELAIHLVGVKPQATAVEIVSRVYCRYCEIYNKLCDCYDQMEQAQRRPWIKKIIDAVTCRIIELKRTLEEVEVFEYTYPDNAFEQMLIQPQDVEILCPFFYPFEIRKAEMQYIMDQIFAGNRLGDPPPTPSQLELLEEERLLKEQKLRDEREAARNLIAYGTDGGSAEKLATLTPEELEARRLKKILNGHAAMIQKMERSRIVLREKFLKAFKDRNLYLELAGLKQPQKPEAVRVAAALLIQNVFREFMELKRIHSRDVKLKEKLGMVIPSYSPPSAKVQLEKVKEARRKFRRAYYEQWLNQNLKEKAHVLRLRQGDIMDDITDEIRQWFTEWFRGVRVFDEFPYAEEGGSILIVKGETFSVEEFIQWRDAEEKRIKAEGGVVKSKEQIKAEKAFEHEIMRMELEILKNALKLDYSTFGMKIPQVKKRKKPKKPKPPKHEKLSPKVMFQRLADNGIVKRYPRMTLDDYWGDRNYAAADCRAVLWTPTFPPPCIGDVKEQVRIRCLLTLGATCSGIQRSHLFVGPRGAGKKSLVYAIATETNALLIDLSPLNTYDKFVGPKNTKILLTYVNKISRLMQPTIIFVDNADKLFYKKVPKEEKMFDPTRLSKDFFKEIVKPLGTNDKVIVIGTATEPWLAKNSTMYKAFPSTIMIPKSDYGSISLILTQMLMKYHGVDRDFNVNSTAQALRGYDISTIKSVIENLMSGKRLTELYFKPLHPMEILQGVLNAENVTFMDQLESDMYKSWYLSYSPWGPKMLEYMLMLESQYSVKLKADKKKKQA
uniref:ATPase AAA-type core domain-containing protein n=1 Tax=Heliothis virescens TaxID=7102 RepID=A0A2A4JH91_HELVI